MSVFQSWPIKISHFILLDYFPLDQRMDSGQSLNIRSQLIEPFISNTVRNNRLLEANGLVLSVVDIRGRSG